MFPVSMTLNCLAVFSFFLLSTFSTVCMFAGQMSTIATEASVHSGSMDYAASISNDEMASVPIAPTNNQEIYTTTSQISYANTCPSGFDVFISSGSANTSLLRSGNDSGPNEIPTISSDSTLTDNTWGFSSDNGETYLSVPSLSNPRKLFGKTEVSSGAFDVIYGIKIDNTIPAGSYTNDIVYTITFPITCTAYTLYFDPNGGTIIDSSYDYDSQTLDYGTVINLANYKPQRAGYAFSGWNNGSLDFTGDEDNVNVNPANHITNTLTASWSIIDYSISYNLDGGSATNPDSYNVESDAFTLNNPTKTGHTFSGWTGTDLSSATKDVTVSKGSTGDRSYTATWTPNTYTLTYNNQSGSGCTTPKTGTYGSAWGDLCTPTRTGHTFGGWYTKTNGGGSQITKNTTITDNLTVYAKWTANTYTLKYDSQGGSACSQKTGTYGNKWGDLCTPSRSSDVYLNYTFSGWYTSTNGGGSKITKDTVVTGSQTVYAYWTSTARCGNGGRYLVGSCWLLMMPPQSWDVGYSFAESQSNCPSGWHTATKAQVETLSNNIGTGLYSYFSLNDSYYFWTSSTYWENGNEYGNHLYVSSSLTYVGYYPKNRYAVTESGKNVKNGTACIK